MVYLAAIVIMGIAFVILIDWTEGGCPPDIMGGEHF